MSSNMVFKFSADAADFNKKVQRMGEQLSASMSKMQSGTQAAARSMTRSMADAARSLKSSAKSISDSFAKVHAGISAGVQKIAQWSKAALGIGAVGVGAATLLGKKGIDAAAAEERTRVGFTTMLGQQQGQAVMAALKEYTAKTPFTGEEVYGAGQQLIGYGVQAQKSTEVIKKLGDVAAVTGAKLGDLAMIYGRVNAGGITMMEANQLSDRRFDLIGMLAQRDGISYAQAKQNISRAQYGVADLDYALNAATSGGGMYAGGVDKLAATTEGKIATLTETVNQMFTALGASLNESIKPVLDQITAAAVKAQPVLSAIGKIMAQVFSGVWEYLKGAFNSIGKWMADNKPLIEMFGVIIAAVAVGIKEACSLIIDALAWVGEQLNKFAEWLGFDGHYVDRYKGKLQSAAAPQAATAASLPTLGDVPALPDPAAMAASNKEAEWMSKRAREQFAELLKAEGAMSLDDRGIAVMSALEAAGIRTVGDIRGNILAARDEVGKRGGDVTEYDQLLQRYDALAKAEEANKQLFEAHERALAIAEARAKGDGSAAELEQMYAIEDTAKKYIAGGVDSKRAYELALELAQAQSVQTPEAQDRERRARAQQRRDLYTGSMVEIGGGGATFDTGKYLLDTDKQQLKVQQTMSSNLSDLKSKFIEFARSQGKTIPVTA